MKISKTARGFVLIDFRDGNGIECSLQESSAAEQHMVWLGCNSDNATEGPPWQPYPLPDRVSITTRMHLTREQVEGLLPALQYFVDTGELPTPPQRDEGSEG